MLMNVLERFDSTLYRVFEFLLINYSLYKKGVGIGRPSFISLHFSDVGCAKFFVLIPLSLLHNEYEKFLRTTLKMKKCELFLALASEYFHQRLKPIS
jgi:hypothetical protein